MELKAKEQLISLFEKYYNEEVIAFEQLPASGSYREYCRLKSKNRQVIGAFNNDLKENRASSGTTCLFLKFIQFPTTKSIISLKIWVM